MIPHVGTCVAIGGRGVLIEGASGTGKSALALALIDRGAVLVGDDGVLLQAHGALLHAYPHPRTYGLIEIRNLGLATLPVCEEVAIHLLVTLAADAPRFIDKAGRAQRADILLPAVALWPDPSPPALKVEHALRLYGAAA